MRNVLVCMLVVLISGLAACQKFIQTVRSGPLPDETATPSASETPTATPSPSATPFSNGRIMPLVDLSDGSVTLTPWITFATGALSFSSGNISIQKRLVTAANSVEFGLVFGRDVERQFLDLLSITPLPSIIILPSNGWMPVRDFNLIQPNRHYGLKLTNANVQFSFNPLSNRELTLDFTFQPL